MAKISTTFFIHGRLVKKIYAKIQKYYPNNSRQSSQEAEYLCTNVHFIDHG